MCFVTVPKKKFDHNNKKKNYFTLSFGFFVSFNLSTIFQLNEQQIILKYKCKMLLFQQQKLKFKKNHNFLYCIFGLNLFFQHWILNTCVASSWKCHENLLVFHVVHFLRANFFAAFAQQKQTYNIRQRWLYVRFEPCGNFNVFIDILDLHLYDHLFPSNQWKHFSVCSIQSFGVFIFFCSF